jgi:hypothetical protein
LRTVAAKYLYSDWVWLLCYISQIGYTNIPHPWYKPRQKANSTVEWLRTGNPCLAVLAIWRKKVSSNNKNAGAKNGLSRLKSTCLFIYDPIVLFCFQNSSLIMR